MTFSHFLPGGKLRVRAGQGLAARRTVCDEMRCWPPGSWDGVRAAFPTAESADKGRALRSRMPRVLIVAPSPQRRALFSRALVVLGAELRQTSSPAEALAELALAPPDIIVAADEALPELLLPTAAPAALGVPVVAVVGQRRAPSAIELLHSGVASFVPQSLIEHELAPMVQTVLTLSQVQRTDDQALGQVRSGEWKFEFSSDERHIATLVEFAQRMLVTAGGCESAGALRACIALEEALRNALFHGNLELSSKLRDEAPDEYARLLQQRQRTPPYAERKLRVTIAVSEAGSTFVIRDDGPGFDPATIPDPTDPARIDVCGGRGVLLMRTFMDDVRFSARGNEVTLFKRRG